MTIGAYIVCKNEQDFLSGCVERLKGVDQLVLVDNGSTDKTLEIMRAIPEAEVYEYPAEEYLDMGALRDFAISKLTTDWVWIVDADEYYDKDAVIKLKKAIQENPTAISFRVKYHQMSWRAEHKQKAFYHYPDRLYLKDVLDKTSGVLPLDMVKVKPEFLTAPNKKIGTIGCLEYDREDDQSHEHPKQPIVDIWYYHLARTRGYNFELTKNIRYQKNIHPEWSEDECIKLAKTNQWVTGLYDIEKLATFNIPKQTIPNPKVSIVISNYNYGRYVGKCIESALNQTNKAHEVIVVDDCSTDNSREIIDKYPVTFLKQPTNKGVVRARNWGIAESTGDFFILIDADDFIDPTYIEKALAKQKATNAQVVYSDMNMFGDITCTHTYPDYSVQRMLEAQIVPSVCALVDRHCFELSGGFREDTVYDDYEFWLRLSKKLGFDFAQIHEFLFNYNRKAGSRVEMLDKRKKEGFEQLNREYGKIL